MTDLELLRATGLATSRYVSWCPEHGVPVRITVGYPRFWGSRPKLVDFRLVAPYGLMGKDLPTDECHRRYVERLDDLGDQVVATLAGIARDTPAGVTLVLLCFEDVLAGEQCHRRWLAEWLELHHGLVVSEVVVGAAGTNRSMADRFTGVEDDRPGQLQLPF
jgi:hypothetical protein